MPKNLTTILGALVAILPFISIYNSWKMPLYVVLGAMIAVVSYREKHQKKNILRRLKKTTTNEKDNLAQDKISDPNDSVVA